MEANAEGDETNLTTTTITTLKDAYYQEFEQRLRSHDIKEFVYKALEMAPEEFWTAECSTSGKYHPPEDQGPGGILRHLMKCMAISSELARFYHLNIRKHDIVVSAAGIHDIKKNGEPWGEHTVDNHAYVAYEWLSQINTPPITKESKESITSCVRYHMSRWTKPKTERSRAMHPTTCERIVQLADYFSSRKCASFLPGVELSEEQIMNYRGERE